MTCDLCIDIKIMEKSDLGRHCFTLLLFSVVKRSSLESNIAAAATTDGQATAVTGS